jgi:GNAT superfamily N-acetyltransferase
MTEYSLRIFRPQEQAHFDEAFASLQHDSDEASQSRRKWWCFENPYGGAFAMIQSGNEIAATCYLGGKRLKIGDKEIPCFEIGETATAPAHQRKGLFMRLAQACVTYNDEQQGSLVYGTPNSQATPGWSKFGFKILNSDCSWLFVIPNPSFWLRFKIPLVSQISSKYKVHEISASEYINKTQNFMRLNASNSSYLQWRLGNSPSNYRYFSLLHKQAEFLCTIKKGVLGKYPVLVIAEHFIDGKKVPIELATRLLRTVAASAFDRRQFMGLYVHGSLPAKTAFWLRLSGIMPHRQLPICAYGDAVNDPALNWFENFQLSDCDIG